MKDRKLVFKSFTGDTVDCASAFASVVHSAFLLLYHDDDERVFDSRFDPIRELLKKASLGILDKNDYETVRDMVGFKIAVKKESIQGKTASINQLRQAYDPDNDYGDGLFASFPEGCIAENENSMVVTLPYSRSLRATVQFNHL